MVKPKVTVTLGRSGQVVRKDHLIGGKRSIKDRLGSNGKSSSYSRSKRQLGVGDLRPEKQIGKNDLRLKLLRKKRSLQIQRDKGMDLRDKLHKPASLSHTVRIVPQKQSRSNENRIPRHALHPRSSDSSKFLESSRRPYPSWGPDELRQRSPERLSRLDQGILPPRISSQMREDPYLRSADFRFGCVGNDDLNYRPTGSASLQSQAAPESSQPFRQLLPSTRLIKQSPYPREEPTTVPGLLQSLGLSKYSINFRAEEVDMPTLRQMGDIDLKEMGIPMGPRKKILLAINSSSTGRPA